VGPRAGPGISEKSLPPPVLRIEPQFIGGLVCGLDQRFPN